MTLDCSQKRFVTKNRSTYKAPPLTAVVRLSPDQPHQWGLIA